MKISIIKYTLLLALAICLTSGYLFIQNKFKVIEGHLSKMPGFENVADYTYSSFYSSLRKNSLEFELATNDLDIQTLTNTQKKSLEKLCLYQIEEARDKQTIAKAYNILSSLQGSMQNNNELFRAIKNGSYSVDILYKDAHMSLLSKLIIRNYENEVFTKIQGLNSDNLSDYFTGYSKDEINFLNKLIELNIDELSARAHYRLSMIKLLGRSSSLEKAEIDTKQAALELQQSITLSNIQAKNNTNIVLVIDDNYAPHAAVTMASALINADLDSFYSFYFLMDPDHPISLESQKKLSSMQNIRNYDIKFIIADHSLLPIELIKRRFKGSSWPILITYRAFLGALLPSNIKSVLSLDADIIVSRDLNYFNTIDMSDYFLAGTFDSAMHNKNYNLSCNVALPYYYINAGVMWFNLENIRQSKATKLVEQVLNESICPLKYFEQDTLNLAFANKINFISHKWNHRPYCPSNSSNINYHSEFITHYYSSSRKKPWVIEKGSMPEIDKPYWRYKELVNWD